MRRSGKALVAKIERGPLDHVTLIIDNEAEPPVLRKERQSVPTCILPNPLLTAAGELAFPYAPQNERWVDPEALCDDRHIHPDGVFFKLDHVTAWTFMVYC